MSGAAHSRWRLARLHLVRRQTRRSHSPNSPCSLTKYAVFTLQIRRVYSPNTPCLLTKYAVFALQIRRVYWLARCETHSIMG